MDAVFEVTNWCCWQVKQKGIGTAKESTMEQSLKDFIEFFDDEKVLVNNPIFLRDAITAYIGTQKKSDDRRNRF